MFNYHQRFQYLLFIGLSLILLVFVVILDVRSQVSFSLYLGQINPLWAVFVIAVVGLLSLSYLLKKNWFSIHKKGTIRHSLPYYGWATLLGLAVILVDLTVVFSEELNTHWPDSLLFYPVMGFIAEIVFHIIPISLVLALYSTFSKKLRFSAIIRPCLLFVAFLEPLYQAIHGFSESNPLWSDLYVGFHVFVINIFQMLLFKRFGFVTMYLFRLWYYLIWHIGWGYFRLGMLF